jgi:hypothetical protein
VKDEVALCRNVFFFGIHFLSIEIVLVRGLLSCQDSMVSKGTMLQVGRPRNYGLCPSRANKFLSSSNHPDQLWSTPSVLLSRYQGFFPRVK